MPIKDGPEGIQQTAVSINADKPGQILAIDFKTADGLPFVLTGNGAAYTLSKENGNGELYSGENALALNLTAAVDGVVSNTTAKISVLTGKVAKRLKLFVRLQLPELAANWNALGLFLARYDGVNSAVGQFFINSNYGASENFFYVTTAGATVTVSEFADLFHSGDNVWIEIELVVDFVNNKYDYIQVGDVRKYLDVAVQVSADATAPHTAIFFNFSHKDGVTSRRVLIDFLSWEEYDNG